MKVAIVGSRRYPNLEQVREFVRGLSADSVIVTGGAVGVDSEAEVAAAMCGLKVVVYAPDYELHGRAAPFVRNEAIAAGCDRMVAFWDGKSGGTAHVVRKARKLGRHVRVIMPGPSWWK